MYRVLLVEDDSMLQDMLRRILETEGFEVFVSSEGVPGVALAAREKPDIIILDIQLPDIDGHEVCQRIKADPTMRHIPVIMLTGEARALESRVRGLDMGAEDYLFKPISPKVIIARMRAILKLTTRPGG